MLKQLKKSQRLIMSPKLIFLNFSKFQKTSIFSKLSKTHIFSKILKSLFYQNSQKIIIIIVLDSQPANMTSNFSICSKVILSSLKGLNPTRYRKISPKGSWTPKTSRKCSKIRKTPEKVRKHKIVQKSKNPKSFEKSESPKSSS